MVQPILSQKQRFLSLSTESKLHRKLLSDSFGDELFGIYDLHPAREVRTLPLRTRQSVFGQGGALGLLSFPGLLVPRRLHMNLLYVKIFPGLPNDLAGH